MVCIGYMGAEAFDIILYTGSVLIRLNIPVLIIDLSGTGALSKSICHGMELDSESGRIHYRGLNYIRRIPVENELDDFCGGVILIAYGLNEIEPSIKLDYINIIADPFPHMMDRINVLSAKLPLDSIKIRVLIRDILSVDDFERAKKDITLTRKPEDMAYLHYDLKDHENSIRCQISKRIRIDKISSEMKKVIIRGIREIFPDIKAARIRRAILRGRG